MNLYAFLSAGALLFVLQGALPDLWWQLLKAISRLYKRFPSSPAGLRFTTNGVELMRLAQKAYTHEMVKRLASFVAMLILLFAAAPLLACMTGKAMTQEESACCRSMHRNCGGMEKMVCCKTEVKTDQSPQLATVTPGTDIHLSVIAWLAPLLHSHQTAPPSQFRAPDEHSPPGLLTAQISVLRI